MPFDLHPEYPPEGILRSTLQQKYGKGFHDRVAGMIDAAGLPHTAPEVSPRSLGALQLAERARDEGALDAVHDRLFRAYWAEGADIGDSSVLRSLATEAGLDPDTVASPDLAERVRRSTELAAGIGVTGVPAWLIDRKMLVPGAQPHEVFDDVLRKLGYSPLEADGSPAR